VKGGVIHLEAGREAEAEAQFREALNRNPNNPEAHFYLGKILAGRGAAREAVAHFERTVALDPSRRAAVRAARESFAARYQEAAEGLVVEERYGEASAALDRAEVMVVGRPRTVFLRGRILAARGDVEGALASYRRALTMNPDDREIRRALIRTLAEDGRRLNEARDYPAAWDRLHEAAELDGGPDLRYLLGTVAYSWAQEAEEGKREELLGRAAKAFQKVLDLAPDDQDASYNLGAVLLAARRFDEAVGLYRRLIAVNPRDGELYLALSLAHSHLGQSDLALAEEAVGRALRANQPVDNPARWAARASKRFPQSDLAEAYRDSLAPDAVYTYQKLGGGLVEVWFYRSRGLALAFRDGGRFGAPVELPAF